MKLSLLLAALVAAAPPALAQAPDTAAAERAALVQFVIVLRPVPRLLDAANWTAADEGLVAEHFQRLEALRDAGRVLLAGRTLNSDARQFGLVVVEVGSEAEAREIMEGDPAVRGGVMTAELFPYSVALQRLSRGAEGGGE
jgi:uncharacterized protein YciI